MGQTSYEAVQRIQSAQRVCFLAADPLTEYWLRQLNPALESLYDYYAPGKDRSITYEEIVEHVVAHVRCGLHVCFVMYGHPGVFAYPTHEAMRRTRALGARAEMLPSVSAEDCLFADLGVDPATHGCQSFEATNFLVYGRKFDTCSALILWQIGVVGEPGHKSEPGIWNLAGLDVLIEVLLRHYGSEHEVTVYEAAPYACCEPVIERVALAQLSKAKITPMSTLYVPPRRFARRDTSMLQRLGLS